MRKFFVNSTLLAFGFFSPAPLALAALDTTAVAPAPATASPSRPNIVVILTDDQGWADIGYNNPGWVYTPNLDKLSATGARFSLHYVMPRCTPTRVASARPEVVARLHQLFLAERAKDFDSSSRKSAPLTKPSP